MSDTPNVKVQAEQACAPKCVTLDQIYQACVERVKGKEGKHCSGYKMDWIACIDKCAAPIYFPKLK